MPCLGLVSAHGGVGLLFVRGAQTPPYAVHGTFAKALDGARKAIGDMTKTAPKPEAPAKAPAPAPKPVPSDQ